MITLFIGFVLGLIMSPFLILIGLAFVGKPSDPPTKEEWKVM